MSSLVKNFSVFADPDSDEMNMKAFRQSLGFFGDSYLGERLYYVIKSPEQPAITLKDYLIYYNNLYNGD